MAKQDPTRDRHEGAPTPEGEPIKGRRCLGIVFIVLYLYYSFTLTGKREWGSGAREWGEGGQSRSTAAPELIRTSRSTTRKKPNNSQPTASASASPPFAPLSPQSMLSNSSYVSVFFPVFLSLPLFPFLFPSFSVVSEEKGRKKGTCLAFRMKTHDEVCTLLGNEIGS